MTMAMKIFADNDDDGDKNGDEEDGAGGQLL